MPTASATLLPAPRLSLRSLVAPWRAAVPTGIAALLALCLLGAAVVAQQTLVHAAQQQAEVAKALAPALRAASVHTNGTPATPTSQSLREADDAFAAPDIPTRLHDAWTRLRVQISSGHAAPDSLQDLMSAWRSWQEGSELQQRQAAWASALAAALAFMVMLAALALSRSGGATTPAVQAINAAIKAASEGDLTQVLQQHRTGVWGLLESRLEAMSRGLSCRVAQIRNNSAVVAMSGQNLARSVHELSERTQQQAQSLSETASSMHELDTIVTRNAGAANEANQVAERVQRVAESGNVAMRDAVQQVRHLEDSSREMGDIISVIDSIAFQTNILALNAAVEAARAGPQGRGFAVVATEVRSLAQRSAASAAQVKTLIGQSSQQVDAAAKRIERVGATLETIVGGIRELAAHVSSMAAGGTEQCGALQHMSQSIQDLKELTARNAEMVQDSAGSAREMELRTHSLSEAVRRIRLRQGSADEARALVESACDLIEQRGIERAAAQFLDRNGGFFDRDMYIFIFNRDGIFTAFGPNPALTGKHLRQIDGLQWQHLLSEGFAVIDQAPGWVDYSTVSPVTGVVSEKMSYVCPLPGDLLMGCGVYKA